MPRLVNRNPKYRKHRASGQAVVTIDGRDVYLGPCGSQASRAEYDRIIGEWLANGRQSPGGSDDLVVVLLIDGYWEHAQAYYGGHVSKGELKSIQLAMRVLKRLYGHTLCRDFGPLSLKAVRSEMVKLGWSRGYVNGQVGRIRRCFKWGVENEKIPAAVLHGLQAVGGLRRGKTDAPEPEPVRPVDDAIVAATLEHVSAQVKAMIELQQLTGMRPGEVTIMRRRDLDTSGKLWTYKPSSHKTQHHGHERTIYLGPKAQQVVAPFLKPDLDAHLFSPADAEAERRRVATDSRTTPDNQGHVAGSNRKRRPAREPGDNYDVDSYRRAIERGCDLAFSVPAELARRRVPRQVHRGNGQVNVSEKATRWETVSEWKGRLGAEKWKELRDWQRSHRWHPHQLRHNAATRLRKLYGLEAAQVILGHQTLAVTEIYAEKNVEAALRIMGEVG